MRCPERSLTRYVANQNWLADKLIALEEVQDVTTNVFSVNTRPPGVSRLDLTVGPGKVSAGAANRSKVFGPEARHGINISAASYLFSIFAKLPFQFVKSECWWNKWRLNNSPIEEIVVSSALGGQVVKNATCPGSIAVNDNVVVVSTELR